ncbi:hypothetical protein DL765_002976 [Monosporascus sp. GIB2]|nr:hypothetical protein DL765_002976 [Monosporascus sp. GIB2]
MEPKYGNRADGFDMAGIDQIQNGPAKVIKALESRGVVDPLDIVICNAGMSYKRPRVHEVKIEDLHGHVVPHVHGLL